MDRWRAKQQRFRAGVRLAAVGSSLLVLTWLFVRFAPGKPLADTTPRDQSQRINLALRRTAHHLLRAVGDSTSRIAMVQQPDAQTYRIEMSRAFAYDRLPPLLQQSLALHRITAPYDVAVLDCGRGDLQLGYSVLDVTGNDPVPCGGRSMTAGCYVLQVRFAPLSPLTKPGLSWPFFALSGLLVSLLLIVWRWSRAALPTPPTPPAADNRLYFGRSSLDVANQTLVADTNQHSLTYREAKLLRLLVSHPNQVLERDHILKLVWEDEGVTVGRSVDVFISRLRKLLANDATVRIAAVHGVGYRLEVEGSERS